MQGVCEKSDLQKSSRASDSDINDIIDSCESSDRSDSNNNNDSSDSSESSGSSDNSDSSDSDKKSDAKFSMTKKKLIMWEKITKQIFLSQSLGDENSKTIVRKLKIW